MRGYLYIATLFLLVSGLKGNSLSKEPVIAPKPEITFTENKGQISDQYYNPRPDVLFSGRSGPLVYYLKENGVSYQLSRVDEWKNEELLTLIGNKKSIKEPSKTILYRIDVEWLNCNKATIKKHHPLDGYDNFYLESCPNGALGVKTYCNVEYVDIYENINLAYYSKDNQLKYDFIVNPGGDYKKINFKINGSTDLYINPNGELVIKTPLGEITEKQPLAFQNGKKVKAKWVINNNIVSFEIGEYNHNSTLLIDPGVAVRNWGTYYGGSNSTYSWRARTDASGNVSMVGYTYATTNIASVGAHQTSISFDWDAYIVKFNTSGIRQWATYYGSIGRDMGYGCAFDNSGNLYMTGVTGSPTSSVIASAGSHQSVYGGGGPTYGDAFLVKFNSAGVRLWGTYYGGTAVDYGWDCSLDSFGNVFIIGTTASISYFGTIGCHQLNHGAGYYDIFLSKFDPNGVRQWSTYYGGTGDDYGLSVSTDPNNNVYISGYTYSTSTVFATAGCHQSSNNGNYDAFLAKFSANGVRQWSTYYGGNNDEHSLCHADAFGNVYLAGYTESNSGTVIATPGSHQPNFSSGGFRNAFLVKFNSLGQRKWGTFYGTNQELGNGCSTDAMGNVFMAGETNGFTNVLATTGNHQVTYGGGGFDAYLVKFDSSGVRQWGTFYGGSGVDTGNECDVDASGNVFVPGQTTTTLSTVIATATGHQTVYIGSNENAFLVKFEDCLVPASPVNTTPVANQTLCANTAASLTASGTGTINWFSSSTSSVVLGSGNTFITPTLSVGNYTYYADVITCAYSGTRTAITVSVFPAPALTVSTSNSLICVGQTASLTANGANIYTWSTTSSGSMIPVSPTITTTYSVTGIDVNGCSSSISITQSVSTCAGFNEFSDNAEIKVFPNPSEGEFLLQLNLNDHTVLIEILDVAGKRLRYFVAKSNETLIDLTEFRSGIYFLRVNNYKPIKISKQ